MISDFLIGQIALETKDKIQSAEVVLDGEVKEVPILRKEVEGNLLKVYVNTSNGRGTITDIRLKDDKDNLLLSKPAERIKTNGYAIISSFYIRFVEEEMEDPVSVFKLRGIDNEEE